MDKVEYEPGESGVIKAFYNTGTHTGMWAKRIRVKSNSIKDNDINLVLRGNTYAELELRNNTLFFYDLVPGKTKTFSVQVINNMNKPLKVKGWEITYPFNGNLFFDLKVKAVKGSGNKDFLKFSLTPKKAVYQFKNSSLTVKVKTNSKQVPTLSFYMRVKIKKVINITPTALFMYTNVNGKTAPATIEITTELENGLKIKSVKCKDCPLDFKVIDISKKDKQILVKPNYKRGKKGKIFSGIIRILVDVNGVKEYSIPVRGRLY
ncbi:hypothetical protein TTHT_1846 [Thermotomaculum hydrothermale]|uniref:Uncharacterized protein n=1 Tax=Thermotomaculum hydrothermale TaxID=981385 RepID=A0A7R6PGH7_9BACT|nr:hypothetical protein [Thermotomaculum hydrothermale]BBB33304.1 hypothetical protein TTHT_1846 [Thermotomaculum hydrothermale]